MSCPHRTHAALIVLAGALVTASSPAAPTDAIEHARQLFGQAEADEDAERWLAALDKLHAVAQVKLTAGVRYHLALCEQHLGQLARALDDYRAAEDQARFEGAKDVLRLVGKQLVTLEPRVPRLTVHVVPPLASASVKLDGDPLPSGPAGAAIPVDPGVHHIEVNAPGRSPSAADITLQEHEARTVELPLGEPVPSSGRGSSATPTPTPTPAPTPTPTPTSTPTPTATAGSTGSARESRDWTAAAIPLPPPAPAAPHGGAIVATATAIALAGLGTAAYLIAGPEHDRDVDTCRNTPSNVPSVCDGLKNRVRALDFTAAGAWAGALAAGVFAIVLWTRSSDATRTVAVRLAPAALEVGGRF
jgi:hypothetical protein